MPDSPLRIPSIPLLGGTLGITLCPGRTIAAPTNGPRDLEADLAVILKAQYSRAAVLLEDRELAAFAPRLLEGYSRSKIAVTRFPIPDGHIPVDPIAFVAFLADLRNGLKAGERILAHCRGGLGRAGLVAACLLVTVGKGARPAIDEIRTARPNAVETREQEDFVLQFERLWTTREKVRRSALGLAVGDALGAGVEFMTPREIAKRHGHVTEMLGGGSFNWKPGETTDDTALALCLAETYRSRGEFNAAHFGQELVQWMATHPPDVGNLTRDAIWRIMKGAEARQAGLDAWEATGRNSAGNGSVMRCAPVAWVRWSDYQSLDRESREQSLVTHADPRCQDACVVVNRLIAAAIGDHAPSLPNDLDERTRDVLADDRWPLETSGYCLHTMANAVVASRRKLGFEEALVTIVNQGDDADTTAAVAGAVLGAEQGPEAIPERWLNALLDRARIEQVAHDLWAIGAKACV